MIKKKPHYVWTPAGPVLKNSGSVNQFQIDPDARKKALDRPRAAGLSVSSWSKANGFTKATATAVLYGHSKGLRGDAHRVAVALGIKHGVVVKAAGFKPVATGANK